MANHPAGPEETRRMEAPSFSAGPLDAVNRPLVNRLGHLVTGPVVQFHRGRTLFA